MNRLVRIRIENETTNSDLFSIARPFEITNSTTVLELKNQIRDYFDLPNQIVSESLFNNRREFRNTENFLLGQELYYLLIIK